MFYTYNVQLSQLSVYQHANVRRDVRKTAAEIQGTQDTGDNLDDTGKYRKKLLNFIGFRGNSFS